MNTQRKQALTRDRILGNLEWLAEAEHEPPHMGIYTWTACWEDWVPAHPSAETLPAPTYTPDEVAAIAQVSEAVDTFWDAFDGEDEEGVKLPEWAALVSACRAALKIMMARGRLTEAG